jgi:Flp pilus assembly protein TadG
MLGKLGRSTFGQGKSDQGSQAGRRHRLFRRGARHAISSMEFAMIAPLVFTMVTGMFDVCKAMILRQEVINAAHSISLTASLLAVQGNATTTLTKAQVQSVESAIFAEIPWLRSGVESGTTSVTLSGIAFSALPSAACNPYTTCTSWIPFVYWSVPYRPTNTYGATFVFPTRTCGVMTSGVLNINTSQTTPLTVNNFMSTLRIGGITYPDPILVADVRYSYTPAFFRFLTGTVSFVASAYWPVRVVPFNSDTLTGGNQGPQLTTYDTAEADTNPGAHCPGYS